MIEYIILFGLMFIALLIQMSKKSKTFDLNTYENHYIWRCKMITQYGEEFMGTEFVEQTNKMKERLEREYNERCKI